MGSGSSKGSQGNTCSLGQGTTVPALRQAKGKTDQPKRNAKSKSPTHNQINEQPSIFLSEGIWRKVAKHMTPKEWVQVSGTCKAMFKVHLPQDYITMESNAAAAVVWAAKHSQTSRCLSLKVHEWNPEKSAAVSAAVRKDGWDLREARVLRVCLEPRQELGRLESWAARLRVTKDAEMWMVDMLRSASIVGQVFLTGVNLAGPSFARYGFPPLAQLYCLSVTTPLCRKVCSSIGQLPALRFLTISKGLGPPDLHMLPTLDLRGCNDLRDVELEYVWFRRLRPNPNLNFQVDFRYSRGSPLSYKPNINLKVTVIMPKKRD